MSARKLSKTCGAWFVGLLMLPLGVLAAESPALGVPLTSADVRAWDFVVMPDGIGLPAGAGDAAGGEKLYQQHCLACHGDGGSGGSNDRLVGGTGSLTGTAPVKTVGSYWPEATTLFDYIRRAMPYQQPGSLSPSEVYALTAYLLHLNGIIDRQLTVDAESLPAIEMPNRRGFVWAVPADSAAAAKDSSGG